VNSELFKSKKAKVVISIAGAIIAAAASGRLSPEIAAYCVTVLGCVYVICQSAVDFKWEKKG